MQADWLLDQLVEAQAAADRAVAASASAASRRVGAEEGPLARELSDARRHGAFDARMCLTRAVNNVVSHLVFGKFLSDDAEFDAAVNSISTMMRESGKRARMYIVVRYTDILYIYVYHTY